jgi:hypothetical protein
MSGVVFSYQTVPQRCLEPSPLVSRRTSVFLVLFRPLGSIESDAGALSVADPQLLSS